MGLQRIQHCGATKQPHTHSAFNFFTFHASNFFSHFFNPHNSGSCDIVWRKGVLTQYVGYSSHEAKFPPGENSSAVATNLVDESLHFGLRLLLQCLLGHWFNLKGKKHRGQYRKQEQPSVKGSQFSLASFSLSLIYFLAFKILKWLPLKVLKLHF